MHTAALTVRHRKDALSRKTPSARRLLLDAMSRSVFPVIAARDVTQSGNVPHSFGDAGEVCAGSFFRLIPPDTLVSLRVSVGKTRDPGLTIVLTAARFDGPADSLAPAIDRVTLTNVMARSRILSSSGAPYYYQFIERPLGLLPRPWTLVRAKDPAATRRAADALAQRAARLLTAQMPTALRKVQAKPTAILSASGEVTFTLCQYPPPAWFTALERIARLGLPKPGDPDAR